MVRGIDAYCSDMSRDARFSDWEIQFDTGFARITGAMPK